MVRSWREYHSVVFCLLNFESSLHVLDTSPTSDSLPICGPPVFHSFDKQNFVVLFRIVLVILVLWVFNIKDRIRLSASKKKSAGTFLGIAICKECTS